MKFSLSLSYSILLLLISVKLFSQNEKITVSKEPPWVLKRTIDYNKTNLDKYAENGFIEVSYQLQISLSEKSKYVNHVRKIISQTGVQNGSEISVSYDPTYEQLIFHSIKIIRKGEIIDKLQLSKIKTIHQENDLEKFLYNGTLQALLILDDVRQGDIIDYSYTIKGFNPIFNNKFFEEFNLQFSIPLYDVYYRLIVPDGRKINFKNFNGDATPVINSANGEQIYEWQKSNIEPFKFQDFTPFGHNPLFRVQLTEFNSWKELNDWALELFPSKINLSGKLKNKIKEIETTYSNTEDRTKEALRFVQDEIRYMGIEIGVNSHKPADPSKVFEQRFGDCKEKTCLLVSMLREMGIDAEIVLINTIYRNNILNHLPSPYAFNHATVKVKLNGIDYFFDPTISHQRGDIKNLFYPDYQVGLIISDKTTSLTPIAFKNNCSVNIDEYFSVSDMSGSGNLVVTSTYRGGAADDIRYQFNNQSNSELMKNYQNFYATFYPNIKADSLSFKDDEKNGVFVTIENYTLPEFWTKDKSMTTKFNIALFTINSIITKPKDIERSMPIEILYPAKYHEKITMNLPKDWDVDDLETHLKNDCFAFNCWFHCVDNQVVLEADYESFKDIVNPEEAPKYLEDVNKIENVAGFELASGFQFQVTDKSGVSDNSVIFVFLIVLVIAGTFIWWSQKKSK